MESDPHIANNDDTITPTQEDGLPEIVETDHTELATPDLTPVEPAGEDAEDEPSFLDPVTPELCPVDPSAFDDDETDSDLDEYEASSEESWDGIEVILSEDLDELQFEPLSEDEGDLLSCTNSPLRRTAPVPYTEYQMITSESFEALLEGIEKEDERVEALITTRAMNTPKFGEASKNVTFATTEPNIRFKGLFQKKRRFTLEQEQNQPLPEPEPSRRSYKDPTRPSSRSFEDYERKASKQAVPEIPSFQSAPPRRKSERRKKSSEVHYGTYTDSLPPVSSYNIESAPAPIRRQPPPAKDYFNASTKPMMNVRPVTAVSAAPSTISAVPHYPNIKMPIQQPAVHNPTDMRKLRKSKSKKGKLNPYEGHTPTVHADVVNPNDDGIYAFSPSAAAFKWNWSLLDVRKRPMGGMTPFGGPTPMNAFKGFRDNFCPTPANQQKRCFLEVGPSRSATNRRLVKKMEKDGLPEFPTSRKPMRAVRKRNLEFSPGGHYGGRTVETEYRPIYDQLVERGGAEPSNFKLAGKEVVQLNNSRPYRPSIRQRGPMMKSSSSHSFIELADLEEAPTPSAAAFFGDYQPLLSNSLSRSHPMGRRLGSRSYTFQIFTNLTHALMYGTAAFALHSGPLHVGVSPTAGVRRLASADQPLGWLAGIVWATFMGMALIYESIRAIFLLGHWRGRPKKVEGTTRGDLLASIRQSVLSSSVALALLAGTSLVISGLGCLAFTLSHLNQPEFLQKETRSFLWTISLIHTGVASGLLTKRAFAKRVPITAPAYEMLSRSNVAVIMSTVIPSIVGWLGVRLLAQLIKPHWEGEEIPSGGRGGFDFVFKLVSMFVGMIEYFEMMGYWKSLVWCAVSALASLFLLDFIDLTISMSSEYYRHGMVHVKEQSNEAKTFNYPVFINLLAQGALATGLSMGSFWQWPLNGVFKAAAYFDEPVEDRLGSYSIVNH